MHKRRLVLAAVIALVSLGTATVANASPAIPATLPRGGPPALSPADIARLSAGANRQSIIVFKNQYSILPARGSTAGPRIQAVDHDQSGVRNELAQLHAPHVRSFHVVNAVAATISSAEVTRLSTNPAVQAVVPDARQRFTDLTPPAASGTAASPATPSPSQATCPANPAVPLLEPEALETMNVESQPGVNKPAAHDLVDGSGVKVGIIADGLDPNNPDFQRNGHSVIFDFQDFSGYGNDARTDGREAFLDAGSIAAQGNQTYDLAGFVNPAHPLPPGCNIRIKGVAPGASIAAMNVAGSAVGFFNSQVIQAIEWAVDVDHVNVLNESIGSNPLPDTRDDPVALANAAAVAAGVTVVAASGDAGPTNSIGSPASSPGIITAGGSTTLRVYRQTTRYGTQLVNGGWLDNNITALSSAGTTEFGPRTVDVVAPGDRGWSLCSPNTTQFAGCADIDHGSNPPPIWAAGGTSASAPLTSGTAALVIEAYAKTHHGVDPPPDLVKRIIVSSATDLGAPGNHQGAGLVNALKAVQLAESIGDSNGNPAPPPQSNGLLVDRTSLTAVGNAGSTASFKVQVTNDGSSSRTVSPSVVQFANQPASVDTGSVTLGATSPTFIDGEGNTDFYAIHNFTVPVNADYLNGDIAWNAATTPTAAFETLFDPQGRVAGYSLLGSNLSGHGHVEVRKPLAGTWTAVIFTVNNSSVYRGPVTFSYTTQRLTSGGAVTPAHRTLPRGQSASFTVVTTLGAPGDQARTLRLSTGGANGGADGGSNDGSLPILLRSLVPVNLNGGSFSSDLTGGGSVFNAGQQLTYQFNVPSGRPALDVGVQLRDPNYNVEGFLVAPSGEPLDVQSTAVIANSNLVGFGQTMQFFRRTPAAGQWTLTLLVFGPIDGSHLQEPFTGTISFNAPSFVAHGIPNSSTTVLPQGEQMTATIRVTNTGNINKDYFADPRLNSKTTLQLFGLGTNNVTLPLSTSTVPDWLVPTNTDALMTVAQGTVPIVLELQAANGDPDTLGTSLPGNGAVALLQAPEVAPGIFFGLPAAQGPFPPGGAGNARVNLAALAHTNAFDPAVSSDTGDAWQIGVSPLSPYSPLTLAPGRTGVIHVRFTPNAPIGTVVRGFIAVDTLNLASLSGDEIALIPYSYRVGPAEQQNDQQMVEDSQGGGRRPGGF